MTTLSDSRLPSVLAALDDAPEDAEAAVLRLFEECHGAVYRYARSFGLDPNASEDIAQEVFLALFRHVVGGRARTNLKGWIFRVTRNLALKRRARDGRRARVTALVPDPDPLIDTAANAEERMMADQRVRRLRAVVRALPERDRQCVLLRAEGLRYREIAAALDMSLGTVANRLGRVVARLQRADGG